MAEKQLPTFDARLAEEVRQFAEPLFLRVPELRGLSVCFDWHGDFNRVALHGLWLCAEGVVANPAGIIGSLTQTLRMLETQMSRAMQLHQHLLGQVHKLTQEVAQRYEEIQKLDSQGQSQEAAGSGPTRQE